MLRSWTRYPDTQNPEDWEVFSRQLRRWKEYRRWQLSNRGQTVEFSEYLDEKRQEFERMGASEFTAQPVFEETVRHQWESEYGDRQPQFGDDVQAVFSRYSKATRRLLMDHGFAQPFQLQADPKQQDQWTTYVEYLGFECYCLDRLVKSAEKLRPQHDAVCERLMKAEVVAKPSDTYNALANTEAEDERDRELEEAARAVCSFIATDTAARKIRKRQGTRRRQKLPSRQSAQNRLDIIARRNDLITECLHEIHKYRTAKTEADHQQRRVEWVRSEISKIRAEPSAVSKSDSSGTTNRKRKPTDEAMLEPQIKKQRRVDETEPGKSYNSGTARSKKRKLPTDENTLKPRFKTQKVAGKSDGPGAGSRKRQKEIHRTDDGAGPSGVPNLGGFSAQVISTVTTDSGTRRQFKRISSGTAVLGSRTDRLRTLRTRTK